MKVKQHRALVRLRYTENGTPWKWEYRCLCGARGLSWQWRRTEDGDLPYVSGALAMALEHVGLLSEETSPYLPRGVARC